MTTENPPTLRQQWKRASKKAKTGILLPPLLALIVAMVLVGIINESGGGDTPDQATEAATEDTEEPQNSKYEITETNGHVEVSFDISGLGPAPAQSDAAGALEYAMEKYPDHDRIVLQGHTTTVDDYGNETENAQVTGAFYDAATTELIDWDNFNKYKMWEIRDGGLVTPSIDTDE